MSYIDRRAMLKKKDKKRDKDRQMLGKSRKQNRGVHVFFEVCNHGTRTSLHTDSTYCYLPFI